MAKHREFKDQSLVEMICGQQCTICTVSSTCRLYLHSNLPIQHTEPFRSYFCLAYSLRIVPWQLPHSPGMSRTRFHTNRHDAERMGREKLNSLPQGLQPRKVSRTPSQDKHPLCHWRELLEADSASRRVPNSRAKNSTPCVTSNHRRSVNTWSSRALVLLLYFSSATSDARSSYASMT